MYTRPFFWLTYSCTPHPSDTTDLWDPNWWSMLLPPAKSWSASFCSKWLSRTMDSCCCRISRRVSVPRCVFFLPPLVVQGTHEMRRHTHVLVFGTACGGTRAGRCDCASGGVLCGRYGPGEDRSQHSKPHNPIVFVIIFLAPLMACVTRVLVWCALESSVGMEAWHFSLHSSHFSPPPALSIQTIQPQRGQSASGNKS